MSPVATSAAGAHGCSPGPVRTRRLEVPGGVRPGSVIALRPAARVERRLPSERLMTAPLMPAAFLGHGSPMTALRRNRFTEAWRAVGASGPPRRAMLAGSAHWYVPGLAVAAMRRPRTIRAVVRCP